MNTALNFRAPWAVESVKIHESSKMLSYDVYCKKKREFFGINLLIVLC